MTAELIGLCGRSGAGKDVIASYLVDRRGFTRLAVADHLKAVTKLAFDLSDEQLWGSTRNTVDPRWGATPRDIYQRLGDALRTIHPDAVLSQWAAQVRCLRDAGQRVVVPDVRTEAETAVLRALGGTLWRVSRPGISLEGASAQHATECENAGFAVDVELVNDAGIERLHERVELVLANHAESTPREGFLQDDSDARQAPSLSLLRGQVVALRSDKRWG